ncbi:RNA methyltransferase [Palleronia pelagia]|uniref:tRNA (cytidine/uridine-2'-O-)-methyltransferase TrmJ n=1 Tax=Palleronia pelagia TaxID=387096 RepID=A0A1H8C0A8_9RHOB|nr:RNA methyltransferase [Palleronia pelagia]SEM88510.1 tRNA/rRNA methyltransferase [Palleronia pelagia]
MEQPADTPPAMILVRPQMGENIGAAARAMLNFGFTDMRLVAPRDGWPNPRAEALASGAVAVLEGAKVAPTLPEAAEDCSFTFATTARSRELTKPVFTPEEAVAEARARMAAGERIGFIFGPERAGLENDDVAQANAIVTVPVNPAFASLNLAQCVLLVAYEWRRQADLPPPAAERAAEPPATALEVERWAEHLNDRLDDAGFFFPPEKAPHMRRSLRNLWSRMPLQKADVQLLHGALRQLVRGRSQGG